MKHAFSMLGVSVLLLTMYTIFGSVNTTATVCNGKPKVHKFRFVVEYYSTMGPACGKCPSNLKECENKECIIADGVQRAITVVNRKMTGPAIEVCKGDTVIVDVENHLVAGETSVHWHGFLQRGTPYMDGTTFITQCPIPEGTTFRYSFEASELGTYFWHSHHGVQKMDGFTGALIVRSGSDPSLGLYDKDIHVITLQDWAHELTQSKMPGPLNMAKRGQQADSLLINGRGRFTDPVTGTSTNTPLAQIKVKSGLKHRMRIINMGCFECPFHLQVEGHRLSVIAVDGFPVKPVTVDTIIMLPGERVDVVLHADQPSAAYWLVVKALADCADAELHQKAVLVYEDSSSRVPVTPDPGYTAYPDGVVLNPMEAKCGNGEQGICTYQLESMRANFETPQAGVLLTRKLKSLRFSFNFHTYKYRDIFNQSHIDHRPFYIPRDGDINNYELQAGQMNNISMVLPSSPPLSQPEILKKYLDPDTSALLCDESTNKHQNCFHYKKIPLHATVDITFKHDGPGEEGEAHPMHLHGYKFFVLYQGYSLQNSMNKALFNSNPVLKDTVNVPGNGYARIRFKADNPGFWLLHCHIVFHQVTGMSVLLHVGEQKHLPPVPRGFPACGDFIPHHKSRPSDYS